jgi:signal peptide peptidase SppA
LFLLFGHKNLGCADHRRGRWSIHLKYASIFAKILSQPLMVDPAYASVLFSAFGQRAGFNSLVTYEGVELSNEGMQVMAESYQVRQKRIVNGSVKPYAVMGDGIAVVSVEGSLVSKMGGMDPVSGQTGYDGIRGKIEAALNDSNVNGIMLNFDSPGGMVQGGFEAADFIASAKQIKPIWSFAEGTMASAAYLIGSQADRILASQTAAVGSVGVLVAHVDKSAALEQQGVKVTLIHSGAHKVDGNPYAPLPEGVQASIQGEIDALRDKFAGVVARGRQNMSKDSVLATEARVYPAQAAADVGFVDGVASFDEAVAQFSQSVSRSGNNKPKGLQMTQSAANPGLTDAEAEALMGEARAEGMKAGAANERTRIQAILGHAQAEGRDATAKHLAFATDMTPDAAAALLATLPQAKPAAEADPALAAMAAGMVQGAGVKPEATVEPKESAAAESEAAMNATIAAMAAMGIKMKA